jgi:PncC family amidohydrolase
VPGKRIAPVTDHDGRVPEAIAVVGARGAATTDADLLALAGGLLDTCVARGLTVATAESCTGGLIAHTITRVPGSSVYLIGGIVSYADRVKVEVLGVPAPVLAAHGAVSAQVARSMAEGVRGRLSVDLAVSVTGIAGPDGGGPAKPVGLTYIAVADVGGVEVRRFVWPGDRAANVMSSVRAALEMLLAHATALPAHSA